MNFSEVKVIVSEYVDLWNGTKGRPSLWVVLACPGDAIQIPDVTFGTIGKPRAGMEIPISAQLIVLNSKMRSESILSTFLHEYGHALYRISAVQFNEVDSEVAAVTHCLTELDRRGLNDLAVEEARAVRQMAVDEPYRAAVGQLSSLPVWQKFDR